MDARRKKTPLSGFFDVIEKIQLAIGGITLLCLFAIVMLGIITRSVGQSLAWTEEATRVFFLWLMWVAVGAGFTRCESSRVTVFEGLMPKFVQKICNVLYYVFCMGLFLVIIVYGFRLAGQQFRMHEMGSAFKIAMWIVGISVPIGGIFGFLGVLRTMIEEPFRLNPNYDEEQVAEQVKEAQKEKGGDKK